MLPLNTTPGIMFEIFIFTCPLLLIGIIYKAIKKINKIKNAKYNDTYSVISIWVLNITIIASVLRIISNVVSTIILLGFGELFYSAHYEG